MPWKETHPMFELAAFIKACLEGEDSMSSLYRLNIEAHLPSPTLW
jgi:hypothetical protein